MSGSSNAAQKLEELGIDVPEVAKPAAAYVPYVVENDILYASGQLPLEAGAVKFKGLLGEDVSVEEGQKSARQCGINLVAIIKDACGGDLSKLEKILHLQVLVASRPNFNEQHLVANGCSDFLVEVFGDEKGSHTRAAYGVASLPLGASVEIAATFKLKQ